MGGHEVRKAMGINITAIHNHMEMEPPRIVFLHYWGVASTSDLAKGIKSRARYTKEMKVENRKSRQGKK
jgi:hypothetical protein